MTNARFTELVTTLFRVVIGLLFAIHGAASLFGLFGGSRGTGQAVEIGTWPGWYAAVIQFVGGVLVLVGLSTRLAAVICSGSMAYAYFVVHQPDGLLPLNNGGELSALFCWSFLLVAALGAGRWSLDGAVARRRGRTVAGEASTVPAAAR